MEITSEIQNPQGTEAQNCCFGCGSANPSGLQLAFTAVEADSVISTVTISANFDGHPGYLHGGIIATLLDEAMSKAVRRRGITAMTRKIEIEYLRPVPSGVPVRLEGRLVHSEERKNWTEAKVLNEKGKVLAEAKGLFIEIRLR